MAVKTSRPSTTSSSSSSSSTSKHKSSLSSSTKPNSLVNSSAKKTLKAVKNKKKGNNKFRDTECRERLDIQTTQLLASTNGREGKQAKQDPFSYGVSSSAEQRRTRRQVDETALALDMLMKS